MHIGSQMDPDSHIPLADNVLMKEAGFSLPPSPSVDVFNQKPAKKPTRQWAAWTRQEEENFFTALREVGKNFEKITCRVQSKNKDQVRHYYYRLVRRMNKLLGPGLCLDAKNSKDTNAAMLRWWSLLEKYSCTASKLHLKPRRFKIFIEALESQLLKDRNRNRRRHPLRDIYIPSPSTAIICKGPSNDARPVKLLAVDSQNIDKVGATNKASFKLDVKADANFNKGDLPNMKTVRQKRKAGSAASAAYRRWEKAAMAGVSLVADAAEQLERATIDRNSSFNGGGDDMFSHEVHTVNGMCSHQITEKIRQPPMKLKLQLFPIDERTRKALEKDAHNPHLELTLSARKRISSVLEHLNRKWGNSSAACGEIMFFPYSLQQEELPSYHRWTIKDSIASAGDVYVAIGSPSIFRLRYGWFSTAELGSSDVQVPVAALQCKSCMQCKNIQKGHSHKDDPHTETINTDAPSLDHVSEQLIDCSEDQSTSVMAFATSVDIPEPMNEPNSSEAKDGLPESENQTTASLIGEETEERQTREQENDVINLGAKCTTLSAVEWADGLTNISVGELLSEASKAANSSSMCSPAGGSAPCLQQIPFSCDSFDAAIAAHVSDHQLPTSQVSHASIWDAEETCDEFSFKMFPDLKQKTSNSSNSTSIGACKQTTLTSSLELQGCHEELAGNGPADDAPGESLKAKHDSTKESCDDRQNSPRDPCLTDIYWPDSLGPWDLDIPCTRYEGQNLVFSDSLSGFNRMVANSLDAFQNCSFFGVDKKDSLASEACGPLFPLEDKIFSE